MKNTNDAINIVGTINLITNGTLSIPETEVTASFRILDIKPLSSSNLPRTNQPTINNTEKVRTAIIFST
jgi:hypothetical protein